MIKINGKKIPKSEVDGHQWVEDIIYHEGPVLSLLKGSTSQDYFYYWVDSSSTVNRWLAIPVSRKTIEEYRNCRISLFDVINRESTIKVVDIDNEFKPKYAWSVTIENVPEDYLPAKNSLFDPGLSLTETTSLSKPKAYKLSLDGNWFLEDLVKLPRLYSQLYSFAYTLYNINRESVEINAKHIFSRYPWRGGFSAVHFFKDLDRVIPSLHEPQIKEIAYASPGFIKLELQYEVSELLKSFLESSCKNIETLSETYADAVKFIKQKEYNKTQRETDLPPRITPQEKKELALLSRRMAEGLNLMDYIDRVSDFSGNELRTLKILMSIHRRFERFITYSQKGMIKL